MDDGLASIGEVVSFVTAVEAGGFAAAAKRMGRSRSAVAKAVGRLEARLGTRLMNRSSRQLSLTDDGRRFHERCAELLRDLREAEAEVSSKTAPPRGVLRIAAPDGYGRSAILPVLARYLVEFPDVEIDLSLSDQVGSLVEQGWDVAIRLGSPTHLPPELIALVIGRVEHVFVASPTYIRRRGEPESLEELVRHEAIAFRTVGSRRRWRAMTADDEWVDVAARVRLTLDNASAIVSSVELGLGIGYVPLPLVKAGLTSGDLVRILPDQPVRRLTVTALYQHRRHQPPRVRAVLDMLADRSTSA